MEEVRHERDRSIDALIFGLAVTVFVGVLLYQSLDLSSGARLVPQLVGVPTFIMALFYTLAQILPFLQPRKTVPPTPEVLTDRDEAQSPTAEPGVITGTEPPSDLTERGLLDVVEESKRVEDLDEPPEAVQREFIFGAWVIAFFLVALIRIGDRGGFLWATPIMLFILLKFINRENWLVSLLIPAGTWLLIWGLFAEFLNVRF